MSAYEAFRVVSDWSRLYVPGEPPVLDRFVVDLLQRGRQAGWQVAESPGAYCNPSACHLDTATGSLLTFDHPAPAVRLTLNRCPKRIRGDRYSGPTPLAEVAEVLVTFRSGVLGPSLAATGLAVVPMDLPRSVVTTELLDRLITVTEVAGCVYPLCEPAADAWREFVLASQFEGAAFDPTELTNWFVRLGWDTKDAAQLTTDFYRQGRLLRAYEVARFSPPPGSGTTTTPPPWDSPALRR